MSHDRNRVTYCEDADDTSSSIGNESTRKYATRTAPQKERPNTGKFRAERMPSRKMEDSISSLSGPGSDPASPSEELEYKMKKKTSKSSDRTDREREARRREKRQAAKDEALAHQAAFQKEARSSRKNQAARSGAPPVVSHERRMPSENPAYYGVAQPNVTSSRPGAKARPASYYAGQGHGPRPPIAHMNWHSQQGPPMPAPFSVGSVGSVGSYPPPQPMYASSPHSMVSHAPPMHHGNPPTGYFDAVMAPQQHDHLKKRFDRPSSAAGFHNASPVGYPREERLEPEPSHHMSRPPSHNKKQNEDRTMPPPDFIPNRPKRAQSAANVNAPFRPPAQPLQRSSSRAPPRGTHSHRRSVNFADQVNVEDEFYMDDPLFNDNSPDPSRSQKRPAQNRAHRRSGGYDYDPDATPSRSRELRPSAYGSGSFEQAGSSYDDKFRDAVKYQDLVSGPQVPLTAETLRRATKTRPVPSSRSTRSSASRDESDYKRSIGTGITRSSSGNKDDFTIKVSGSALVRVHGAEIEYADGGEISFTNRPSGSRSGSDQASTVYQIEDARSRVERKALPHRSRAPSQSDSQSRSYATAYSSTYAPYDPSLAPDNDYI